MTIENQEEFDIFLSHSHLDSEIVEKIAKKLEDTANLRVWLDKWILTPGEHWQQAMARGLYQAKACAICIGAQTPSGWFKEEIERSLNRQTKDDSFRVIPVLLPQSQEINVDDFLELRTWVHFKNGINDEYAFHILVSGIRGLPPGRFDKKKKDTSLNTQVRQKLEQIKEFRDDSLIDSDIAKEYQRKLLDKLTEI